jgi:hypothetical protein
MSQFLVYLRSMVSFVTLWLRTSTPHSRNVLTLSGFVQTVLLKKERSNLSPLFSYLHYFGLFCLLLYLSLWQALKDLVLETFTLKTTVTYEDFLRVHC